MQARFAGTCATTARRYDAGTEIRRARPEGWEIADGLTDEALTAAADATIVLQRQEHDFFGFDFGVEQVQWAPGVVCRASWWEGSEQRSGIVVIATAGSTYDREEGCRYYRATARLATEEEAAPILAAEAERRARHEAEEAREAAERLLLSAVRPDRVVGTEPPPMVEKCWISPDSSRRTHLALYYDAEVLADGSVVVIRTDHDDDRSPYYSRITEEHLPGVADIARAAARRRTAPDGTEIPLADATLGAAVAEERQEDDYRQVLALMRSPAEWEPDDVA